MMWGWWCCKEMVGFCANMYLALSHPLALQGSEQVTVRLGDLVHVGISVPSCLLYALYATEFLLFPLRLLPS